MNIDKDPILGQEELDAQAAENTTEERRKVDSDSDRSLQAGLIRWMGTRN